MDIVYFVLRISYFVLRITYCGSGSSGNTHNLITAYLSQKGMVPGFSIFLLQSAAYSPITLMITRLRR